MKKFVFPLLLCLIFTAVSAQDITSVFLIAPDSVLFGLSAEEKDKLVANPEDTASVVVPATLYKNLKRLAMTDDYISLQTSSVGTLQIKLLPLVNNSKIICVVNTVCGKACDSRINFFTTDWMPLENSGLFPSVSKEWFIKPGTDRTTEDFKNAYAALDMTPVKMEISGNELSLTAYYDIQNYLSEDDYKKIQPYLIEEPKVYLWDKISFK